MRDWDPPEGPEAEKLSPEKEKVILRAAEIISRTVVPRLLSQGEFTLLALGPAAFMAWWQENAGGPNALLAEMLTITKERATELADLYAAAEGQHASGSKKVH